MNLKPTKRKFQVDFVLVIMLVIFTATSLLSIYLAAPISNISGLLLKQGQWVIISVVFLLVLIRLGRVKIYELNKIAYWFLLGALALLILDRFIDLPFISPIKGSRSWYVFPKIGSFQPSEFMKWVLLIGTSEIIDEHNKVKKEHSYKLDILLFYKVIKYIAAPLVLMILQPDTGIPLVILAGIALMIMISGIKRGWIIFGITFLAIVVGGVIFLFETNPVLLGKILGAPYKLSRFYGWLETERYYLSFGNQLYQSLLTIGSAGLLGHPLREVVLYFPEPQNDFIFTVIIQNLGLIGGGFVLLITGLLNFKIASIAGKYSGFREKYLVAGFLGILLFQQIENMGMVIGLLPITGITLPLISYGGSSLLSFMIPFSIVFLMSSRNIEEGR